jgi:hypothetical protein
MMHTLTEIQPILPIWTNGQRIRIPRQFSSTTKGIYSCVVDARHLPKEQLWESLKEKLQSSPVDRAVWR